MSKKENKKKGFSRRKFLVRSSIGLGVLVGAVYFTRSAWRKTLAGLANTTEPPYLGSTDKPFMWFDVSSENIITLHTPKVEMGQGTFTGLAQIAADELEIRMNQIRVVHAESISGNLDPFATGGSTSILSLFTPLRELAATTREMFKNSASKLMSIPASELSVKEGVISGGGKSKTFGEIVKETTEWDIPDTPSLKPFKDYKFIGKPIPRVDLVDKVMGAPIFGMDASMPNMLYGAVLRPSQVQSKLISADTKKAAQMPGVVKVVKENDFIGVVANSYIEAENAKNEIKAEWSVEKVWEYQDVSDMIKVGKGTPIEIQSNGKAKNILDNASSVLIESEYTSPMGAHAQIEPNGAVAHFENGKVTIKMSTQVVQITRDEVAKRLGISKKDVNIIPTFLGGGFGRRLHTPNAMQAAVMSKVVGQPVKSFLTRKEEFQHDTFRPPTHHTLRAKLTEDGKIEAIEHNVSSGDVAFGSALVPRIAEPVLGADLGAWRGGMFQYKGIPNFRAVSWRVKLPFATSWWRSLGLLANTFAIESFLDELAEIAGKNPVEFRLQHIQDDKAGHRLRQVIQTCAEKAGYKNTSENGRAMGFAASTDVNTPCAHVAEVSIVDGKIKVHKVTCVMDPGIAVNPDQVKAQCEGSIIMGLSAAMFEKMSIDNGTLNPTIYGPYQMALMKHAPKDIDVIILQNDDKPGAVGEPPLGPIGAAIANAAYRLTGKRLRDMPLEV